MSHVPHELAEEFPEYADKIHELKLSNNHFRNLAEQHHTVNREIHRIETESEAASDMRWEELKKKRLNLSDEIRGILASG